MLGNLRINQSSLFKNDGTNGDKDTLDTWSKPSETTSLSPCAGWLQRNGVLIVSTNEVLQNPAQWPAGLSLLFHSVRVLN